MLLEKIETIGPPMARQADAAMGVGRFSDEFSTLRENGNALPYILICKKSWRQFEQPAFPGISSGKAGCIFLKAFCVMEQKVLF